MYFYPHFLRTKYLRYRHYKMCPRFQSHQMLDLNPNSSASEAKFLPATLFLPFLMIISTFYTSLILILWDFHNLQNNPLSKHWHHFKFRKMKFMEEVKWQPKVMLICLPFKQRCTRAHQHCISQESVQGTLGTPAK